MKLALAALLVAASSFAGHVLYRRVVRRRFPPTGARVATRAGLVHVRSCGSGPVAVLVHGSNGVSWDFPEALIAELARDHTVLALDRPGHGHSDAPTGDLDLEANAAAVLDVAAALGPGPAVLVGHSYGAAVVLRAALDDPEQVAGVVAVTPATVLDARNSRWAVASRWLPWLDPLVWLLAVPAGVAIAPGIRRAAWHPERPPGGPNASRAFALCPDQIVNAARNARHLRRDFFRLAADLPRLGVPLEVLAAAGDRITPPDAHLAPLRGVRGARVQEVPAVGHWMMRSRPGVVAEAVRRIRGREGSAPGP